MNEKAENILPVKKSGSHNHTHDHGTKNISTAFFLNTGFAIIEVIGGLLTNSVAILSDALHDFGDSLSLGVSWYFQKKSKKEKTSDYTYGYQRFSLLGAFLNATVLIVGSIFIISEAISRISDPQQPDTKGMIILAILGIAVNGFAMLRLKKGDSINEKVVSLHFLEDVLGWVAVLVGAIIMSFADVPVIDPLLSLLIALFVLFNVYRNIKPAIKIILQGVPGNLSEKHVFDLLQNKSNVKDVHDLKLWSLDGNHHVASLHVTVDKNMNLKEAEILKDEIKDQLKELDIVYATIEVEYDPAH